MGEQDELPDYEPLPDDWSRALAIVAHPDDMEFAAASAVAAWTKAGKSVAYVLLTRGEAGIDGMEPAEVATIREAEQRRSCELVGVGEVEFLDFPDGLIEYGIPLRRAVASAVRRHRPELVIGFNHHTHSISGKVNSPDHRHAGQAVIDGVADASNPALFRDIEAPAWGGVQYLVIGQSPHATHAVDVSETLDIGIASLEAHEAYLRGVGINDVRGPLEMFTSMFGQRFGGRPALVFEMIQR